MCWQNDNRSKAATSGHVFVDGIDVASAIMRAERCVQAGQATRALDFMADATIVLHCRVNHVERSGAKTSTSTVRPFVFGELQLTDDERIAPVRDPSAADIGQIRLEITRVVLGAEVPFKAAVVDERGPVHERAKKAGAHVTRYGKAQRATKGKTASVSTAPYDVGRDKPWVTFVFRYRSRGMCYGRLARISLTWLVLRGSWRCWLHDQSLTHSVLVSSCARYHPESCSTKARRFANYRQLG